MCTPVCGFSLLGGFLSLEGYLRTGCAVFGVVLRVSGSSMRSGGASVLIGSTCSSVASVLGSVCSSVASLLTMLFSAVCSIGTAGEMSSAVGSSTLAGSVSSDSLIISMSTEGGCSVWVEGAAWWSSLESAGADSVRARICDGVTEEWYHKIPT